MARLAWPGRWGCSPAERPELTVGVNNRRAHQYTRRCLRSGPVLSRPTHDPRWSARERPDAACCDMMRSKAPSPLGQRQPWPRARFAAIRPPDGSTPGSRGTGIPCADGCRCEGELVGREEASRRTGPPTALPMKRGGHPITEDLPRQWQSQTGAPIQAHGEGCTVTVSHSGSPPPRPMKSFPAIRPAPWPLAFPPSTRATTTRSPLQRRTRVAQALAREPGAMRAAGSCESLAASGSRSRARWRQRGRLAGQCRDHFGAEPVGTHAPPGPFPALRAGRGRLPAHGKPAGRGKRPAMRVRPLALAGL